MIHTKKQAQSFTSFIKDRTSKILLVTKNEPMAKCIQKALPAYVECVAVSSGLLALDLIEMWKPDAVLIETHISDMLYDALCSKMRCSKYMARTPIIIISERSGLLEKYRCIEAGASDYIKMPLPQDILAQRINHTLNEAY